MDGWPTSSVAFSAGLSGPRPLGVHFDVKPYGLPEWTTDQNGTATQHLDLLEALRKELVGSRLSLVVDIPFGYDARKITRGGVARPMHEWEIDLVDVATLMDYRDHADPPDGIVDNASVEMACAGTKTKKLVLGVETICRLDPPLVTFGEEGAAAMGKALAATRTAYAGAPAFGGFAVHHDVSGKAVGP